MTRHIMLISLMWFLKIRHELTNSTEATVPSRKQPELYMYIMLHDLQSHA